MTHVPDAPSPSPTQQPAVTEVWATATVRCVLVHRGQQVDVELRNADGVAFLRKTAADAQAAKNEASVLRLYAGDDRRPRGWRGLKPFGLVVQASGGDRQVFAEVLRSMGLRVLSVGAGREAVAAARELVPDLILLDDRLDDVATSDLCRELRAMSETADIPIVIVTASPETVHAGDPEGPDVVLAKPCGFDTISATARLLLRDLIAAEPAGDAP